MVKAEWGTKRACQGCGVHFYDLQKNPIICPACNAPFSLEALVKSKRAKAAPKEEIIPLDEDLGLGGETLTDGVLLDEDDLDEELEDMDVLDDSEEEEEA